MLRTNRSPFVLVILAVFVLGMLSACTDDQFVANTYKTLKVSADTYDQVMQSAGELYSAGLIDDEVRDKAIDIGLNFQMAHQTASLALDAYATAIGSKDEAKAASQKIKLEVAAAQVGRFLGDLVDLIAQYQARTAREWRDGVLTLTEA